MRSRRLLSFAWVCAGIVAVGPWLAACTSGETRVTTEPVAASSARSALAAAPAAPSTAAANAGPAAPLRLFGAALPTAPAVSLIELAKAPDRFRDRDVVTEGTVTAVCQHRGCWMNLKSDDGEAFVRMAGHAFLIPRDAQGRRARIAGRVRRNDAAEPQCSGEGHGGAGAEPGAPGGGCKAEAETSLGHPLAKLEFEATGVELY